MEESLRYDYGGYKIPNATDVLVANKNIEAIPGLPKTEGLTVTIDGVGAFNVPFTSNDILTGKLSLEEADEIVKKKSIAMINNRMMADAAKEENQESINSTESVDGDVEVSTDNSGDIFSTESQEVKGKIDNAVYSADGKTIIGIIDEKDRVHSEDETSNESSEPDDDYGDDEVPEEDIEDSKEGYEKTVTMAHNIETGEDVIIPDKKSDDEDIETSLNESFDDLVARLDDSEMDAIANKPITEEEKTTLANDESFTTSSISPVFLDPESNISISKESIMDLIELANRKIKKEDFNVYKEFPQDVKDLVDHYVNATITPQQALSNSVQVKTFRNSVSESLLDEFIRNITYNRIKSDFNNDVEKIFNTTMSDTADSIIGYSKKKLDTYHEAAEKITDPEKKAKLEKILDIIDEAYTLEPLKKAAFKIKIKPIEYDKPQKVFDKFLFKYRESPYHIYDIRKVDKILRRQLPADEFTDKDINAFLILFCKYSNNLRPDITEDHAFMYYVLYNAVVTDLASGTDKETSEAFLNNIKEVINNIRIREGR